MRDPCDEHRSRSFESISGLGLVKTKTEEERLTKAEDGKWKHVFSLSRQFLQGEQTKAGQQGRVVAEEILERKHFVTKCSWRYLYF